jgi:four helix bundle protein
MAQAHQDLTVWQRAMEMTEEVYALTKGFPKEEIFGLASQLRRASVSVASNIAEGRGRLSAGECRQFLGMAQGSNYEVQTQLDLSRRLAVGDPERCMKASHLSVEVGKMLSALIDKL